ncbi:ribosomal protein uL24 [Cardinium endosymbiont of Sogatella furcifera]|uniref:50S ribosomal protein L24 n=1 Tax=Cardinium endosymbiont of Sogatella furcifera TaxID=650378 RepID=UPI000E0E08B6|nr:50S ribosomal protein L24 [Cardinium endosymbiont of Sogatella furcifera]AXI24501.1 ribosomal protein uL24 [Cardinium endosymbiont of Sogatella furcifera]
MKTTIKKHLKVHIRRGDRVKILAGKHRNEQGTVLKVFPKVYRAIVEGMNIVARHVKPSASNPKGTIQRQPSPIHISNLMLIDPASGEATRVGRKHNEVGKLQRYAKKTGNFIKNV